MTALIDRLLGRAIQAGTLEIVDADGERHIFGGGRPHAAVRLHDRALVRRLALNPKLALGEAYTEGTLTLERGTLSDLLEIAARNAARHETLGLPRLTAALDRLMRGYKHFNPVRRARRNAHHHYDVDDELYAGFLDADRQYSCAYFRDGDETLDEAQLAKKTHIAAKLCLDRPDLTVLDIGSGWGGLAEYLARETKARVTGLTLSDDQFAYSEERASDARLTDRMQFALRDYRSETGRYDRIVSVGMLEHVGSRHYRQFFECLSRRLADDGVAVVHAIGRRGPPGAGNPWLARYVFPGGYTPALSEVLAAIERTDLWVTDVEILRLHYARTLAAWYERFEAMRADVAAKRGERFCRMWEFYLKGCEMAFRHMGQMVFQIQLARRPDAVPLTRDYMSRNEAHLHEATGIAA